MISRYPVHQARRDVISTREDDNVGWIDLSCFEWHRHVSRWTCRGQLARSDDAADRVRHVSDDAILVEPRRSTRSISSVPVMR